MLAIAAVSAAAQERTAQANVVGTWQLVTYEDRTEQGPPVFPYGEKPRGLLSYDASGRMSIQIMTPRWTEGGRQWTGIRVFERVK